MPVLVPVASRVRLEPDGRGLGVAARDQGHAMRSASVQVELRADPPRGLRVTKDLSGSDRPSIPAWHLAALGYLGRNAAYPDPAGRASTEESRDDDAFGVFGAAGHHGGPMAVDNLSALRDGYQAFASGDLARLGELLA